MDHAGPSKQGYIAALLVFILSVGGSVLIIVKEIYPLLADETRFVVPGSAVIRVKTPSQYTLWTETSAVVDGQFYTAPLSPPVDLNIRVYEIGSGRSVKMESSLSAKETSGSTERESVTDVSFDQAGEYRIEVTGDFSKRTFLIRRSLSSAVLKPLGLFVLLSIAGWIGAPIMAIVTFARRYAARKPQGEQALVPAYALPEQETPPALTGGDERKWAMFCHFGALSGYVFPFCNILAPLLIWVMKGKESPFVDDQGKESLNFQVSMIFYFSISILLIPLLVGILFLFLLALFNLIIVIIAGIRAQEGQAFRYPLTIRLIR